MITLDNLRINEPELMEGLSEVFFIIMRKSIIPMVKQYPIMFKTYPINLMVMGLLDKYTDLVMYNKVRYISGRIIKKSPNGNITKLRDWIVYTSKDKVEYIIDGNCMLDDTIKDFIDASTGSIDDIATTFAKLAIESCVFEPSHEAYKNYIEET